MYVAGERKSTTVFRRGSLNITPPREPEIPLYNHYGIRIRMITVEEALKRHGKELELRARGYGRRRRFTSAKQYAVTSQIWAVSPSAGFSVLQLITQ